LALGFFAKDLLQLFDFERFIVDHQDSIWARGALADTGYMTRAKAARRRASLEAPRDRTHAGRPSAGGSLPVSSRHSHGVKFHPPVRRAPPTMAWVRPRERAIILMDQNQAKFR
jgi:hypothetical protein